MKIDIRRATIEDANDIAYIGAYSWYDTYKGLIDQDYLDKKITKERLEYSVDKTKKLLENTDKYFVALVDDKVVGFVFYDKSTDGRFNNYGYLESLYLSQKYQNLGIGKLLFKKAVIGLKEMGFDKFYLHCLSGNNTLGFYEKYTGNVIEKVKYPLRDFDVDADVVVFEDIDKIIKLLDEENYKKKL